MWLQEGLGARYSSHTTVSAGCRHSVSPSKTINLLVFFVVGLVHWDVFKTARLDNLRHITPADEDFPNKGSNGKSDRVQHSVHSASKMPASFISNSPKEQRMLAYLEDFQRVFSELYPHR